MKRSHLAIACLPMLMLLAACSEEPQNAASKEAEKPAVAVSSQSAVGQMYITARAWAGDAMLLNMANIDLKDVKSEGGKAGAWECTFVSPSRHRSRRYTYSVSESNGLSKGVANSPEDSWSGESKNVPFTLQYFKTDATAAYATAMKKSADYVTKHPDSPMKFILTSSSHYGNPQWRVVWGDSIQTSNYSVVVDATTGEYVKTLH
ncbi:MAG: hypothetical protein ABSG25_01370 [Bryobacteraceae bacterium]